jgi:hypothetical protein
VERVKGEWVSSGWFNRFIIIIIIIISSSSSIEHQSITSHSLFLGRLGMQALPPSCGPPR